MAYKSEKKRSLAKTITWRIVSLTTDFLIVFLFIKKIFPAGGITLTAVGIAISSNFVSMIMYYLHERAWNRVRWGKEGTGHSRGQHI